MPRVRPPKGLSKEAQTWFRKIVSDYELRNDNAALLLLEVALQSWDEMRICRSTIAREGFVLAGRFGEKRAHPAVSAMRSSRSAMLRAMTALGLSLAALDEED
jgi:P27 family predicted phage terminase small subunit